ncbi:iron complex transport system ATP-binding protein [Rhizobium sp. SG_E_25_P2]|uniref:ABC transporter ATP-binding protein n=1 Tax=Rhizobium sp. SG_E_25_P2 TaxID=2879942 RepID=UPI002474E6E8|nr:ABC transporter ATP-binding protein [Rhizobium sp. SG_E_25_P2]MDH6267117.1 iron complex transport system ATP-binding protein [Rhizobium sp. SG_E_25_P2]
MTLVLDQVTVRRGRADILKGLSATLPRGRIVGLVGANGAGKSTLINAITRQLPFCGAISWNGGGIDLRRVGHMPQHCQVQAELTVVETVLLGRHELLGWRVETAILDKALAILADFGVEHLHDRSMASLSGGQQQLVLLAQRMLRAPELLLLDEATSALDLRRQMQVFARLRAYVDQSGALALIAIHDLNLAARHVDDVLLIDDGVSGGFGPFSTVIDEAALRRVYGVEAEIVMSRSGHAVILPLGAVGDDDARRERAAYSAASA